MTHLAKLPMILDFNLCRPEVSTPKSVRLLAQVPCKLSRDVQAELKIVSPINWLKTRSSQNHLDNVSG